MDIQEKQTKGPECDIEGMHGMFSDVRRILRAATVFAKVGTVAVVIGTILPFWLVDKFRQIGIFLFCYGPFPYCVSHNDASDNRQYGIVLLWKLLCGLVISGYLTLLVGLGCLCSFLERGYQDPRTVQLAILTSVFLTLAAACISTSVIVHLHWWLSSSSVEYSIGFAWYVTIVGVVCLLACVICLVVGVFKYKGSRIEYSTYNK